MLWKDWIFTKELTKEREREIGRRKKSRIFSSFLFFLLFFFFLRHKSTTNSILLPFLLCSSQLIRAPKGLKDGQDISGCLPRVNLCVNRLFFQNLQEGASFPGQDVIRPLRTASVPLNIQVNVIKQEGRRKGEGVLWETGARAVVVFRVTNVDLSVKLLTFQIPSKILPCGQ